MKPVGIFQFLGSNCDRDVKKALDHLGLKNEFLWGEDFFSPSDFSAFILPGGFSYGDYLRAGALASLSSSIQSLKEASKKGMPILGICNGFQILCETGLLEGCLLTNETGAFIDKEVEICVSSTCPFWGGEKIKTHKLPIAHKQGRFFAKKESLKRMQDEGLIWLVYKENPNGSLANIAGVFNKNKNIAGLMPHPERAIFSWSGVSQDGLFYFETLKNKLS